MERAFTLQATKVGDFDCQKDRQSLTMVKDLLENELQWICQSVLLLGIIESVSLHLGLFHQGIAMSGSSFPKQISEFNPFPLASRQAALLNCPTDTSQHIKDCLLKKDAQEIASSLFGLTVSTVKNILLHTQVTRLQDAQLGANSQKE